MLGRLLNAKPAIHNLISQPPKRFPHLDTNLKRKELMEGNNLF
jgi:hypothetical protein